MEVQLTAEQEAQLVRIAEHSGKGVDDIVSELVDRLIEEDANFRSAVQAGLDAAERGEFVATSEVWAAVERVLKA